MPLPTKPDPELTGWKEIATYLGVSIRTAQSLEQDQGLPVHRMPGTKGRVWTTAAELDAWKRTNDSSITRRPQTAPGPVEPPAAGDAAPLQITTPPELDRRKLLRYGLTAASTLGLTGIGLVLVKRRLEQNTPVTALRVEGPTLVALDSKGGELWRHTFQDGLADDRYPSTAFSGQPYCLIADAEGDGRTDVLFQHISATTGDLGRLVCFDASGKVSWQFLAGKSVTDNTGSTLTRPYSLVQFQILASRTSGVPRVIVVSIHYFSFPTQVAVLDGKTGKLISEYWHRGHLKQMAIADLDGDGEPEILLAGVNDAKDRERATLVVFDHRNIRGASCDHKGEPYFQGMSPGTEKRIVFFPRTLASADKEFNLASTFVVRPDHILVVVNEGPTPADPYVDYEFDFSLRVTNVALAGPIVQRYRELQDAGKLPKGPLDLIAIQKRLGAAVEVI